MPKKDFTQIAHSTFERSIGEDVPTSDTRDPKAVARGRLGGAIGGKQRSEVLTPEQRREIAKKAAEARWRKYRQEKSKP